MFDVIYKQDGRQHCEKANSPYELMDILDSLASFGVVVLDVLTARVTGRKKRHGVRRASGAAKRTYHGSSNRRNYARSRDGWNAPNYRA